MHAAYYTIQVSIWIDVSYKRPSNYKLLRMLRSAVKASYIFDFRLFTVD